MTNQVNLAFEYDPVIFLRCHSNQYDPKTDIQTKVWHAEFEPDPEVPNTNTNIVATSGGHSICFINVIEGKVLKKYFSTNPKEIFYCFTFMKIPLDESETIIVLAAGSSLGKLHVIHPSLNIAIGEIDLFERKRKRKECTSVNAVCLYKDDQSSSVLLCGMSDGSILSMELKGSTRESNVTCDFTISQSFSLQSEVFQIAFCATTQIILAACSDGLTGIPVPSRETFKNNNYQVIKFKPSKDYQKENYELADTVQIVGNGFVSVRFVLRGAIYILDLKQLVKNGLSSVIEFSPKYVLKWSETDNYFMNIGINKAANLLACGDDKGTIWLYDTKFVGKSSEKMIPETKKLEWPIVNDKYSTKKKKLKLDVYDIVINKVAIHSSSKFLVAVTDNNTVCLWKRVDDH